MVCRFLLSLFVGTPKFLLRFGRFLFLKVSRSFNYAPQNTRYTKYQYATFYWNKAIEFFMDAVACFVEYVTIK